MRVAYDQALAERVRGLLSARHDVREKRMFGGLTFMLGGNMCCGVAGDELVQRVGTERAADAVRTPHARYCDFTGKPMSTMITVAPAGCDTDHALRQWVDAAVAFVSGLPPQGKPRGGKR